MKVIWVITASIFGIVIMVYNNINSNSKNNGSTNIDTNTSTNSKK